MAKRSLADELADTRVATGEILGWCLIIALNQEFGKGINKLYEIFDITERVSNSANSAKQVIGWSSTVKILSDSLSGSFQNGKSCKLTFEVPRLRAAKNRKERQLLMAGNEGATMAWLVWANAVREVCKFGKDRMNRLHEETWKNYDQFNHWAREDAEMAWSRLKMIAEGVVKQTLTISDEPIEPKNKIQDRIDFLDALNRHIKKTARECQAPMLKLTAPLAKPVAVESIPLIRQTSTFEHGLFAQNMVQ